MSAQQQYSSQSDDGNFSWLSSFNNNSSTFSGSSSNNNNNNNRGGGDGHGGEERYSINSTGASIFSTSSTTNPFSGCCDPSTTTTMGGEGGGMFGSSAFDVRSIGGGGIFSPKSSMPSSSSRSLSTTTARTTTTTTATNLIPPSTSNYSEGEASKLDYTPSTGDGTTSVSVDNTTNLIANELSKLTFDERNDLYEDIHGVLKPTQEPTHDKMQLLINEMKDEIRKIKDRIMYNKANFLAPSKYGNNNSFLIMFLRSTKNYNPKIAANRCIQHFEYKAKLFGKDKVAQDITLSDMNDDDKDSLLNGCIQFLSETDSSGRPIVFYYGKHITPKSWKNWVSQRFV